MPLAKQLSSKFLGQVATPPSVADLMAKWVLSGNPKSILDPAVGAGALLKACRQRGFSGDMSGIDIDPGALSLAKGENSLGARLDLSDYLKSNVPSFDGIIANPPYVKAQHLDYSDDDWRFFESLFDTPLDRCTNLYALFLLKIWHDLSPCGRAAVILPAELLNANFGDEIKACLTHVVRPSGIAVFHSSLNIFSDALTTSLIVFLDKGRTPGPCLAKSVGSIDECHSFIDAISTPVSAIGEDTFDIGTLSPSEKWLNLIIYGNNLPSCFTKKIGDYFYCRRGIATGANDFFCLRPSEMKALSLAEKHVAPCITKASDANGLVFTDSSFHTLSIQDRRCFLLSPEIDDPSLWAYLDKGRSLGIHERHLPSHRPVWYQPEKRASADILVSVFSRGGAKFILNNSDAKSLTCFHGLYAKPGYSMIAPLATLFLNSSLGRTSFSQVNRFYGNGLDKLEPRDVEDMPCPEMPEISGDRTLKVILSLLSAEKMARKDRDRFIDSTFHVCFAGVVPAV